VTSPKVRSIGLRGGLWVLGGLVLLVLAPLAVFAPAAAAICLIALALLGAALADRRLARLAASQEKLSSEIGVLSQRLLKLETVTAALVRHRLETAPAPEAVPAQVAPGPAAPEARRETERLSADIEEVTTEIGLLSGIVRELAAVVATQDGDIARLKAVPPPAPAPAPIPTPAPPRPTLERAPVPGPRPVPPVRPAPEPPRDTGRAPDGPPRDPAWEAVLVEAFDGEGLEVFLQPVVTLPQRKVVSYEALARLRVGADTLPPEAFLPVLERHGRTTALDRRMLQRVATIARHLQSRGSTAAVAYGLSPLSLYEPGFLRSLGRLVSDGADLSGRLMVALPQASWRSLDAGQAGVLAELRGRVGFLLDRPTDLRFDPAALAERGVAQIKVPASLLLRPPGQGAPADIALEDLAAALARSGIRLVATEVEREAEVPDLIDLDVPLAQGSVFAVPRAVRAEVLAPGPDTGPPPSPEPPPEPPPQRRPFRDFLRRAS